MQQALLSSPTPSMHVALCVVAVRAAMPCPLTPAVCVRWGGVWGQHRHSPTLLPCGCAGHIVSSSGRRTDVGQHQRSPHAPSHWRQQTTPGGHIVSSSGRRTDVGQHQRSPHAPSHWRQQTTPGVALLSLFLNSPRLHACAPFHHADSLPLTSSPSHSLTLPPTHCLSLHSHPLPSLPLPSPPLPSPPLPSPPFQPPSQDLRSSTAGRLRRHAMPAAHAALTPSAKYPFLHALTLACHTLVAVPSPVAPPSSLALELKSWLPIQLAAATVLSLALCARIAGTHTGRRGEGRPLREAAGGAAAALISRSPISGGEGRWGQHRYFPMPLPCGRAGTHGDGRETAAWQSHCSKGEYQDGPGLSRSLAMQQRQLTVKPFLDLTVPSGTTPTAGLSPQVFFKALCSLDVEGRGAGVNIDTSPRPSPVAVQGLLGTGGRDASLQQVAMAATRESIGWPLPSTSPYEKWREGRGGQHRRSPAPLPCGRAGTHGDGRAAAMQKLAVGATRESIGVGWPLKVRCGDLIPSSLFLPPFLSCRLKQHPAWTTEEPLPPLIPPSLSTSQQPQHHGALHGCGKWR
ncbi:unnamed protein product [Closterium sp. NIES-65]|nr:unnamed protein product [Closterium sp. NIES-65]